MYRFVVFDLDGTLLDTLEDLAAAANYTLRVLGLPTHPTQAYKQMVGNGIPKLVERFLPPEQRGPETQALALDVFRRRYATHNDRFTRPYPGILPLLDHLLAGGLRLGVLSNKSDDLVPAIVARYFGSRIAYAMGLREDLPPKPDPASLQLVLARLGASPAATLYCGDSDVDMHTARAGGLPACGVLWGFRGRAELEAAGASLLAETPRDLERILLPLSPPS